ncbi:MAG: hypothetical protein M9894_27160 [Planctomycetes bacterium]|nr:hypothetical protein [Planctomycetota bacterium]
MTRALLPALPALLFLAALAGPVQADPVARLTALVQQAANTANPTMAVMRGLAAMPDFTLGQADIQRALRQANLPRGSLLERVLGPTTRLVKRGDRVEIDRSQTTRATMETGQGIELGRKVTARFRVQGSNDALIDEIRGIKVGENARDLYDLRRVQFTRENGKPVAKVTAGAFVFSKTVTIDLSPRSGGGARPLNGALAARADAPASATSSAPAEPSETPGLVRLVPQANRR